MKIEKIQKRLRKEKVEGLLLTHQDPNFVYLTQLKKGMSFSLLFIPKIGKPKLFVTSLDKEKKINNFKKIVVEKPLKDFLKKNIKSENLACNFEALSVASFKRFKKMFSKSKFHDWSTFLLELRSQKTEQEISYLRIAAKLTITAFKEIIAGLQKNKFRTEKDIERFLFNFAYENNTELSFPPIVASGKNTRNPHHQNTDRKLNKGFLMLDFGISYQNYCSDMTRMVYLGKPKRKELEMYNFLFNIQKNTLKSIHSSQTAGEIEKQVRKEMGEYSSYFIHGLGHGVGVEIHESPSLKPDSKDLIKEYQVLTIEPGIYLKEFGLRIEDTILIGKQVEILTKTSKKLIIIT